MRKLLLCLSLVAVFFSMRAFAAETVIYENDFSDPTTLGDFVCYGQQWEIKNGGLYLTETFLPEAQNTDVNTSFSHLIYQTEETLTDYVIEVDYRNIRTAGGIVFRANADAVTHRANGFCGYLAFISNEVNVGALGSATDGNAYGNINIGTTRNSNITANVHIKVTVKGDKIDVLMTNIDNGKPIYAYTYTIGTSASDHPRSEGTFGLRMRTRFRENLAVSADNAYFDNLKVTTAKEATIPAEVQAPVTPAATSDTRSDAAESLYALGLLAGKGNNADGSVRFDLEGSLTRAESITQVVRFLGAEKTATEMTNAHPFTDLAAWAVPYISYAYANGITQGVSAARFGSDTAMSEAAFLTAMLRVLGYTDKNDGSGDFVWSDPYALAKQVGLIQTDSPNADFRRGDAFLICLHALTAKVKDGDKLCDRLVKSGVVTAECMANALGARGVLTIGGTPITSYTIVLAENTSATQSILANAIVDAVAEKYGVTLPIVTDSTAPTSAEIVIGKTTRPISERVSEVGAGESGIIISGTSLALLAQDSTALRRAASAFTYAYIEDDRTASLTDSDTFIGSMLPTPTRSLGQSGDPCIVYDDETEYYYAIYSAPKNDRVILYRAKTIAELGSLDTADGKEIYVAGEHEAVKHRLYAPELKKMDGKWYIYASGATSWDDRKGGPANPEGGASKSIRLFCLEATSDDPYGDYAFKAYLDPNIWAIDIHPFTYKDVNYVAFAFKNKGNLIAVARLTNPWTIDPSTMAVISIPTYDFELRASYVNEGPFTFTSPDGRFFMLYSGNDSMHEYCLGLLEFTGDDILSKESWTKSKVPLLAGTEDVDSPGHCSVFMSPDGTEYWVAYHFQSDGRKLCVKKMTFDAAGNPVLGIPAAPGTFLIPPSGE